jgi:arylsulfatase A-like enzyme
MPILLLLLLLRATTTHALPNVIHIMGDDVGYDNIGLFNNHTSYTPHLNALLGQDGIYMSQYHTFKICGPSRASTMTGRYPFNVGFYGDGTAQHITNYTTTAELLRQQGYTTSAIGKWDVGYVVKETTATYKGFDTFLGYYKACNHDLFYHTEGPCSGKELNAPTDMSRNVGTSIGPERGVNGTYSTRLFTHEALTVLSRHFSTAAPPPLYMYLAPQNVHLACGSFASKTIQGIQAPCSTVRMFPHVKNDTYKGQTAVTAELDFLVGNVTQKLQELKQWNNTVVIFTSDNGGPLGHTTNYPLRGGKHTFWDGGVRVVAGIGGGFLPLANRGTVWDGLAHSSDWYRTVVEGMAQGTIGRENTTGPMPDDSFNLWPTIINASQFLGSMISSPRTEIIHQVSNQYFTEDVVAMRSGDYKLIVGNPGDARRLKWPELSDIPLPFGLSGGSTRDQGTSCLSGVVVGTEKDLTHNCSTGCLYNVRVDPEEQHNLIQEVKHQALVARLKQTLKQIGDRAPPPSSYWTDPQNGLQDICEAEIKTGFLEPVKVRR